MLVLTRKCQEMVVVGGAEGFEPMLKVTVLGIDKGKVRLGFDAGRDIRVHRLEVWERIRAMAQGNGSLESPQDTAIGKISAIKGRPLNGRAQGEMT